MAHRQKRKTRGKRFHTLTFTAAYVSSFSLETQADNSDICSSCSCINIWGCSGMQYNPTKVKDRGKKKKTTVSYLRQFKSCPEESGVYTCFCHKTVYEIQDKFLKTTRFTQGHLSIVCSSCALCPTWNLGSTLLKVLITHKCSWR